MPTTLAELSVRTSSPERSPSSSSLSSGVKTSHDWMSLFLGSKSGNGLNSPSILDKIDSSKMYERSFSSRSSTYSSSSGNGSTSYGSRYYSGVASSYLSTSSTRDFGSGVSSSGSRFSRSISSGYQSPYTYRTRISRDEDDEDAKKRAEEADEARRNRELEDAENGNDVSGGTAKAGRGSKVKKVAAPTVMNGNVIRLNRKSNQVLDSSDDDDESEEEDEEDSSVAAAEPVEPPPPPPPPEDPLDVEERMLNAQLTLSLTLTMTDEENLRQRLMEIRKLRIRKNEGAKVERGLIERFEKESEQLTEASKAKEEEERILINRLKSESIREVEQKDIQVRLQELFRDRKSSVESTQKSMETHYEHMLQETSTETTELDSSIRGKQAQIEKLQDEILSMTVRKEQISLAMEKVNHKHLEQLEQLGCQRMELEQKMSKYAVLAPPPLTRKPSYGSMPDSEQLRELEQELECPICMDISRPPIYQCEEGHIICSTCKPLLTTCPHCSKIYSSPVIRCRFAEKLSEKYFKIMEEHQENLMQ